MTDAAWETLSNQAVAACGVVYFLALLAHLVEWASLRKVPVAADAAAGRRRSAPSGGVAVAAGRRDRRRRGRRAAYRAVRPARRSLLTVLAVGVQFVALVARGMAADPDRVPWGNMYEFTLAGTFVVVVAATSLLYRRYSLRLAGADRRRLRAGRC